MSQRKSVITGGALELPIFKKLAGRRVILASSSPRRKDILAKLVSGLSIIDLALTDGVCRESNRR
jgi:hypothetical protein